jgi:serine/threonine protein kinase
LGALKLLQENQTRERRARLVREVSDLEKLVGIPGIPRVLEHNASSFERTGDSPYIILELISGETLNERFQRALDIETSVRLILNLCEIVGSCHACGVCHRDIKPNNIMIGPNISRLWLIDFGMSWSEEAAEHFETEANQEIGNRSLRLPEFSGVHPDEKHDSRSDLAQICGVLFWLLFHRRPGAIFDGQNRPPHRSREDQALLLVFGEFSVPARDAVEHRRFKPADLSAAIRLSVARTSSCPLKVFIGSDRICQVGTLSVADLSA